MVDARGPKREREVVKDARANGMGHGLLGYEDVIDPVARTGVAGPSSADFAAKGGRESRVA